MPYDLVWCVTHALKAFCPECKEEAVKQLTERGYSVAEVSARLRVSSHSLFKWPKAVSPDNS
ncbi:transposase [Vogesella amnigena]|uniref:Transposase n=1 Tax=Vogesella amnigena TaxID=1507449 RepID=A0ABV7TU95_9NEIS